MLYIKQLWTANIAAQYSSCYNEWETHIVLWTSLTEKTTSVSSRNKVKFWSEGFVSSSSYNFFPAVMQ